MRSSYSDIKIKRIVHHYPRLDCPDHYSLLHPNGQSPQILEETKEEKDLRVVISNSLKSSAHIAAAANKANKILGTSEVVIHVHGHIIIEAVVYMPC